MSQADFLMKYVKHYQSQGLIPIPLYWIVNGVCACRSTGECQSPGKHPIVKRSAVVSATDAEWDSWVKKFPSMNLGILTGSDSGIFVLDVDPRHQGEESFQSLIQSIGSLPETLLAKTGGGGWHYVFKIPSGFEVKNSAGLLGEGLDIRGEGGYIVVEPSITKGEYKWL